MKQKRFIKVILTILLSLSVLSGCSNKNEDSTSSLVNYPDGVAKYSELSELNGKTFVVSAGTVQEDAVKENFESVQCLYVETTPEQAMSVISGKADAMIINSLAYNELLNEYPSLAAMSEPIESVDAYFGMAKTEFGNKLKNEMDEYIASLSESGELDEIIDGWVNNTDEQDVIYFDDLNGENGTIRFYICAIDLPAMCMSGEGWSGMEAEILKGFCEEYGYKTEIDVVPFASVLAGLSSGKADMSCYLVYTDERAENILFSGPYYSAEDYVVVQRIAQEESETEYSDIASLSGKTVAVPVGGYYELHATELIPGCIPAPYTTIADTLMAVSGGKAEAAFLSSSNYENVIKEYDNLTKLDETVAELENYFGIGMTDFGAQIKEDLDEYLVQIKESGKLDEIANNWYNDPDNQKVYDLSTLQGSKGTIHCAVEPLDAPYAHTVDGGFSGMEVDIMYGFCEEYGYSMDLTVMDWSGVLPAMASGKIDLAFYVVYTDERAKSIYYSGPYESNSLYVIVRNNTTTTAESSSDFFTSIKESFEKNFITESRYKLILNGLLVTIELSILSAFFGTILGALICALRRSHIKLISSITAGFIRIIQGIPIVVVLLVLYYIIFGNISISGLTVGVIGFSLNFGVYSSEIMRSGIESIDNGQWEAASSLGFSKFKTLTKVILPQAINRSLPVYKGELISLVKSTSIVGYIAVQDLTKASDIIRSRTYDAFFPLIVTAIIYFVLAWALTFLLGLIEIYIDPKRRKNPLKGIDTTISSQIKNNEQKNIDKNDVVIELKHLRKEYETATPLKDVNVQIHRGDVISIIGPSGTGKSTLLRCINRLEMPTSGEVYAFGKAIPTSGKELNEMREKVGMVFQSFNLFNNLTIIENIMLAPITLKGISRQQAYEKGISLLRCVGLGEKALCYPNELSGGQKQRVAIVRTLAMEPEIILFDEPTSALDPTMINEVLHVISGLAKTGLTMLIVTHEMKFARDVSNRVFYMDQGGIYEDGSSEQIFEHPIKERTRAFILRLKLFSYNLESPDFDFVELRGELENFAKDEFMNRKQIDRAVLCTEEILMQGLHKLKKNAYPGEMSAELSENGEMTLIFHYGGDKKNVIDMLDDLSISLVKAESEEIAFNYDEHSGNTLKLKLKS